MRLFIFCFLLFTNFCVLAQLPRYNQVYQVATHNSYWVHRAATHELFATGTQERLLDQLHFDHARGLEIDIHKIKGKPGQWAVYHTSRSKNVFFQNFTDFLKQLQQFQYSLPKHEVVTVVIELKEILEENFDATHTPAQLDSLLQSYIGPNLFSPADLMQRCPGKTTLCDCAKSSAQVWPTIDELRGKVIFLVLGNFHVYPLGHGGLGWATYANSANPVAFPMSSDFSVFGNKKGRHEFIPGPMLKHAYEQSIFQQVEKCYDSAHLVDIAKFIANGGVVRGGSSFSLAEQQQRINAGFNLLQTDYPWIQFNNKGYGMPFRPKDFAKYSDPTMFMEPGNRIYMPGKNNPCWIYQTMDTLTDWETLPSTTRTSPDDKYPNPVPACGKGCLVAKTNNGKDVISICRQVNATQNAVITISDIAGGIADEKTFISNERTSGLVGDYIRMTIQQVDGNSNVSAYSSSQMEKDATGNWAPKWNLLYTKRFTSLLSQQGLQASDGDVLFVGTKRNGIYVDEKRLYKGK